MFSLKTILFEM